MLPASPAPQRPEPARYLLPPVLVTEDGDLRRVGIEVELTGLTIEEAAGVVQSVLGGRIERSERLTADVRATKLGDFRVELDSTVIREKRYLSFLRRLGVDVDASRLAEWLSESFEEVASSVVPCEIVTPPLPLDRLCELDALWVRLAQHDARGTHDSLLYAFGLHFNPEAPDLQAGTLTRYLRAFVLLSDWLVDVSDIDVTRRVMPYIDNFPARYRELVARPDYAPDLRHLIDDYLVHNASRNRRLDMLPLLACIDRETVLAVADEPHLIKPRPAFHYRLPNCDIGSPMWSPSVDWNRWIEVERLAYDPPRLDAMAREYAQLSRGPLSTPGDEWIARVEEWLGHRADTP